MRSATTTQKAGGAKPWNIVWPREIPYWQVMSLLHHSQPVMTATLILAREEYPPTGQPAI